ncbi:MAG: transposase [Desulfuromusa sp.]
MPRKPRIDLPGFHHIINRGVNRQNIFLCEDDKYEFLRILAVARETYHLTIHSFCILDNHYHLLVETCQSNLSLSIRYVNSQYAIYFNKKMERVGPLWQGRFKSWYVLGDEYLHLLIRYIEMNPVKAGLTKRVAEYPFSSSYFIENSLTFELLVGSLLHNKDMHDWLFPLSEKNIGELSAFKSVKYEQHAETLVAKKKCPLSGYFSDTDARNQRNYSIYIAFQDGYLQGEIARYLHLSAVAVSRIISTERKKQELFNQIRDSGLFWSYAPDIQYDAEKATLLIETVLKYADMPDIKIVIGIFGVRHVKKIWDACLKNDARFKRLNYFLARVFFNLDMEADDFAEVKSMRGKKLRLLAG